MAERKKRGLGRGLGALINSDTEDGPVSGAAVHAVPALEPEIEPEPLEVSRETSEFERPIDVFFSAKSHAATRRVSRETNDTGAAPRTPRVTTTRRGAAGKRAQMPDVLGTGTRTDTAATEDTEHSSGDVSPETKQAEAGPEFQHLPVVRISPNPRQPREVFDEDDMAELIHSVREIGVLQPVVVRPVSEGHYELIMGERRWRASQAAQRETIPAVIRHTADEDLLRDALLENIHRSQLNPLEEAAAYQQLLDDFGISQDELSKRIGRSRPQISNTLRLMRLPAGVQRRVAAGVLSSGHARAVLSLDDVEQMEEFAQRIVAEGLSVRSAEEQATLLKNAGSTKVSRETNRLPSATRVQELDEYSEALTDRLDTQVKISMGAKKGRIAIDFASIEDLERILEQMGAYVQR